MKLDTQGSEVLILKGAKSSGLLEKTDFIIMEVAVFGRYNENAPTFLDQVSFMDQLGFVPFDFVEMHNFSECN